MGGGKGGSKAPAPDPNVGRAAMKQAELGEEWLGFAREQFEVANERQGELDALTKRVGEQQLATQDQANEWSRQDRARYEDKFLPIEDKFIDRATTWDSPERQAQMAGEARGDVIRSADMQRQDTQRQMASMGVNPASGRFAGINRAGELGTALSAAGAQNNARGQVRREGMAMLADASNMGRGLPSQAAGAAGLGLSAGGAALSGAHGAAGNQRANTGIMGQGYSGAMQGYGNQANILNQQHQNKLQAWSANQQAAAQGAAGLYSGLGTVAGAAMVMSDERKKKNKREVSGALEAVKGLPIEAWEYTDEAQRQPVAAEIIPPDDKPHVGTYAQDFARETGIGDGQTLPMQDAIGITMKAIQELDAKVEQMAGKKVRKARTTA